jgi:hypothetical protein
MPTAYWLAPSDGAAGGTPPPQTCSCFVQVKGDDFVTINNKKPICGAPVP